MLIKHKLKSSKLQKKDKPTGIAADDASDFIEVDESLLDEFLDELPDRYFNAIKSRKQSWHLFEKAKKGDLKAVKESLAQGARPSDDGYRGTPIIYTLCVDNAKGDDENISRFSMIKYLINQHPECIHARTNNDLTVIWAIVRSSGLTPPQRIELLDLAFKNGGCPNLQNLAGNESLLMMIDDPKELKLTIKYKPNPLLMNNEKRTPLMQQLYWKKHLDKKISDEFIQILNHYESIYRARIMSILIECTRDAIAISEQAKSDKDVIKIIGGYMDLDFQSSYDVVGHLSDAQMDAFTTSDDPIAFYKSLILEKTKKDQPKTIRFNL